MGLYNSSDKMKKAIKGMKMKKVIKGMKDWSVILIPVILSVFCMGFKGEAMCDG